MKEKNEYRDKIKKTFAENGLDDFQDSRKHLQKTGLTISRTSRYWN